MKMFDINGKLISVDIRPSSYPIKSKSKSNLQGILAKYLMNIFPRETILEEFSVPGSRLSLDFYLPNLNMAIEVDGDQHDEYNVFFHGERNKLGFSRQVNRDVKKEQWCETNDIKLIRVKKEEDFSKINHE